MESSSCREVGLRIKKQHQQSSAEIDPAKTAPVIASPQNDLLRENGVIRGVVDKRVKENHRVESLEALSKGARRKRIRRFESSARVYVYSFDNANESRLSDESSTRIYQNSQRLDAPPPNNQVLRRSNSDNQRPERSWHLRSIQALLTTGSLAFLSVISLLLMEDIHPVPTKLTLQKDAAELARLETQLRLGDSHPETRSLPSAAASNAGTERIEVQPEEHSGLETPKSTLIASRISSVARKRDAGSGEAKKNLRLFKKGLEGRPNNVRNLQSQRAIATTLQPYKHEGLGSFFSAMGRALGFSTHRDPL
jgi:hypothetical protein